MEVRINGFRSVIRFGLEGLLVPRVLIGMLLCLSLSIFLGLRLWRGLLERCAPAPSRFDLGYICYDSDPGLFGFGLIFHMVLFLFFMALALVVPIGAGIQRRKRREIEELLDRHGIAGDRQRQAD